MVQINNTFVNVGAPQDEDVVVQCETGSSLPALCSGFTLALDIREILKIKMSEFNAGSKTTCRVF